MKAIVLGAGKGTRLQSEAFQLPKVLRKANGRALIDYVLEHINFIPKKDTVVVVGYKKEDVKTALSSEYLFSDQDQQLGTGHAVNCAREHFEGYEGDVLVLYGDMPLLSKATYEKIIQKHVSSGADCTVMTAVVEEALPYGRIIKDEQGNFIDVVETKDCTPEQLKIQEMNIGVYVFRSKLLFDNLKELKNNNAQGEYYLTDIPKILLAKGAKVTTCTVCDSSEIFGVNTVEDLQFCEAKLKGEA
ncbi:MAG: UDP-N-acetylglucosamine diphosphorylase [Ruminococcaceae bacterium]|nr:UDP-N-acetylglucosamine diphosphorylase [Oscillospiraceae bacterium]